MAGKQLVDPSINDIAEADVQRNLPMHTQDVNNPTVGSPDGESKRIYVGDLENFILSTETGITAYAGGGQANARALTAFDNEVTTVASANDSVKLLSAVKHRRQTVRNDSVNDLDIYPQSGENFNGLAANAPYTLSGGGIVTFVCFTNGEWK
jgi:hypothetical protein